MRRKETRKGENTILTAVGILLAVVVVCAVLIGAALLIGVGEDDVITEPPAGIRADQAVGEVEIIAVTPGTVDPMQLVTPSGTRSLVMPEESVGAGSGMTLRNNETVYEFFKENNATIPTRTREQGYVKIKSPEDVPLQDLIFQDDDLTQDTSYDRRSAYLACLYEHSGFEVGGTSFPSNVSVPCHAPVLAQFDEIQAGTSKELGNDTVTTPLILEEGEYRLVGGVRGDCVVLQSVSVSATVASGESLGEGSGTCAQSEIGGEGSSGGEGGGIPGFAYLIALALVVGIAAVAYRRF